MNDLKVNKSEAWIDNMPSPGAPNSILDVALEITSKSGSKYYLTKKIPQGINPSILMLELLRSSIRILIKNPQPVSYSESAGIGQYTKIEIYNEGALVSKITDIKVAS